MFDHELFEEARKEFLSHLLYAKGRSKTTCYVYRSDIGIWGRWLVEADKDWLNAKYQVESPPCGFVAILPDDSKST